MASKIETICNLKIVPLINDMGYEVIEVDYSKKAGGMNLTFTLYKPEGIFLSDCEKVHKMIDEKLEELNPTEDKPYILNVESEGLDRPIKNHADFLRHKGEKYQIKLYAPIEGKKVFEGNLTDYSEAQVVLEKDGKQMIFERAKVANIVPILKF